MSSFNAFQIENRNRLFSIKSIFCAWRNISICSSSVHFMNNANIFKVYPKIYVLCNLNIAIMYTEDEPIMLMRFNNHHYLI